MKDYWLLQEFILLKKFQFTVYLRPIKLYHQEFSVMQNINAAKSLVPACWIPNE